MYHIVNILMKLAEYTQIQITSNDDKHIVGIYYLASNF